MLGVWGQLRMTRGLALRALWAVAVVAWGVLAAAVHARADGAGFAAPRQSNAPVAALWTIGRQAVGPDSVVAAGQTGGIDIDPPGPAADDRHQRQQQSGGKEGGHRQDKTAP